MAVRVRDVHIEVRRRAGEASAGDIPFVWGHALMGSMAQDDDAGLLDWESIAEVVEWVRYDARGHGLSETTLDPDDYQWANLAQDLWALVSQIERERAVLGGVSMGSATALHAAVANPERVAGLVLMAPPTAWETRARQSRFYRGGAATVDWFGIQPLRRVAKLAGIGGSESALDAMKRSVVHGLERSDKRSVMMALQGAAASDLPDLEALESLEAPTLILAWPDDPSHPISTAETLAERLPRSELHIAESSEDVERWKGIVQRFLAQCAAA